MTLARRVERLILANWESLNLETLHWLVGTLLALRRLRDPSLQPKDRTTLQRSVRAAARAMEADR